MNPAMLKHSKPLPTDSTMLAVLDPALQLKYAPWRLSYSWGYTEIVMRLGGPHHVAGGPNGLTVVQYPLTRASFVPHAEVFLDHLNAASDAWQLHDPRAFEFVSWWSTPLRELASQTAFFRRGDSAQVIVATDVAGDSLFMEPDFIRNLVLQRDYDLPATVVTGEGDGVVRFRQLAAPETTLASIELFTKTGAGRSRFAAGPPPMPDQRVTLSDVLLVEPRNNIARDLDEAASRSLGRTIISQGSDVSLFWEMYGLKSGEVAHMSVVVTRKRGSFLGGLLGVFSSRSEEDSLAVTWDEAPAVGNAIEPRGLNLALRSLQPGSYTLSVTAEVAGQERLVARRSMEIGKPVR